MDSEKILFCYRDDKLKKPVIFDTKIETKAVAAIPCSRVFFAKRVLYSPKRVKRWIAESYETVGAQYLWLEEELCRFLEIERMDLPEILIEDWLVGIPFFHTLIFADDDSGRALDYIHTKIDKLVAVCVVCYEKYVPEYEDLATNLFQREGIYLQIFTYEMLEANSRLFREQVILKGRTALLDFEQRRTFWDRRLEKDIGYYSFWNENRLFLDTFKKNSYNTLTK